MASDDRKAKGTTAPKTDAPQQSKSTLDVAPSNPKTDAAQQGKESRMQPHPKARAASVRHQHL